MVKQPLYRKIASTIDDIRNCQKTRDYEWEEKHKEVINKIEREYLPNNLNLGFDKGTVIDLRKSTENKLVLTTSFHHMDTHELTDHAITVRPSLRFGIELSISGRDRNYTKEYICDVFMNVLMREINF